MSRGLQAWVDDPTTLLLLGLVGVLTCQLVAPLAWIMARTHVRRCALAGRPVDDQVRVARALGVIGTALLGLWIATATTLAIASVVTALAG